MLVINLYGGPGTGKSTAAAEVFAKLKKRGIHAELVREPFKAELFDGYKAQMADQIYLTGRIYHEMMQFARGGVDVVVTDCPLLLGLVYNTTDDEVWRTVVKDQAIQFDNLEIILERNAELPYQQAGRRQSLEEAKLVDQRVEGLPFAHPPLRIPVTDETADMIVGVYELARRIAAAPSPAAVLS